MIIEYSWREREMVGGVRYWMARIGMTTPSSFSLSSSRGSPAPCSLLPTVIQLLLNYKSYSRGKARQGAAVQWLRGDQYSYERWCPYVVLII
jgi:hypothetical protein